MEHLRSEPFQLGSGIGRPHHNGINPAASFEGRDDAADQSGRGDCAGADPTQFQKPSLMLQPPPNTNMADVSKKFHQLVVKGGGANTNNASNAYGDHNNISRTISQDTAETSALSIASELTAGTAYTAHTSGTTNTDATLDAAIANSRDRGHAHALLELSTIEEDSTAGAGGITDTPGGKSNAATAGVDNDNVDANVNATEKNSNANTDTDMKMDISADVRSTFPSFLSTLPPTWSGASLSFIKFLLFVKESDEAFIPEMDRMLADYDRLVTGLQSENASLKTQLRTEIGTLKKRVHDKKRLVQKLTKKLTECQGYITELTDELERIYRENKGTVVPSTRAASLAAARPASDDITVTSEITMEQSLHQSNSNQPSSGSVEKTLSRMLAEERSRAETLAELNRSVQDDLADARTEVDELERRLAQSDRSRRAVEATVQGQWHKVRTLLEENKTLHEDVAGVVIELSDAKEEFTERESQLIHMIEEGGEKVRALIADNKALHEDLAGVVIELSDAQEEFAEREAQLIDMIENGGGGAAAEYHGKDGEEEEDGMMMEVDGANVHDLEANIAVLQEELEVSRRVMESIKRREKESSHKAGELLIRNETLRTKQAVMEEMHQKEAFGMRREIDRLRRENADMRKAMQQNRSSQYMFSK